MVSIVLTILAVFYAAQTVEMVIGKFNQLKQLKFMYLMFLFIAVSFFISRPGFYFFLFFLLIWWSRSCRSSDYGLSYHFLLAIVGAVAIGPVMAIPAFLGVMLATRVRKDMQVIDVFTGAATLAIITAVFGLIGPALELATLLVYSIYALMIYNVTKFIVLFGKVSPVKLFFFFAVHSLVGYLLLTENLGGLIAIV